MHKNYRIIEGPEIKQEEGQIIKLVKSISHTIYDQCYERCEIYQHTKHPRSDYYYFSVGQNYLCIAIENNNLIDNSEYFTKLFLLTELLKKYNNNVKISEPFELKNENTETYNLSGTIGTKEISFYSDSAITNIIIDNPDKDKIINFCKNKKTKLTLSAYLNQSNPLEHSLFLENSQYNFLVSLIKKGESYYMEIEDQLNKPINLNTLGLQVVLGEILITHEDLLRLKKNCQIELSQANSLTGYLELPDHSKIAKVSINWDEKSPTLTITDLLLTA